MRRCRHRRASVVCSTNRGVVADAWFCICFGQTRFPARSSAGPNGHGGRQHGRTRSRSSAASSTRTVGQRRATSVKKPRAAVSERQNNSGCTAKHHHDNGYECYMQKLNQYSCGGSWREVALTIPPDTSFMTWRRQAGAALHAMPARGASTFTGARSTCRPEWTSRRR